MIIHDTLYLEHFGVLGMKWGVRKDSEPSKKRKRALVFGSVVGAAALAAGAAFVAKKMGTKVDVASTTSAAKSFVESVMEEPTGILHGTRGKNRGFGFLESGGLTNPLTEYAKAGLEINTTPGFFSRYGDNFEKVAAIFNDPDGRRDFSGRVIPHVVIVPKGLSEGLETVEDVVAKVWPLIRRQFDELYDF